jgi:phosphoadenosine phosphosulfate reductase
MLISSPRHTAADLRLWAEYEDTDRAWAQLSGLARKVDRSIDAIRSFATAPCYAGVSGGIDSMCLTDLILASGCKIPFVFIRAVPLTDPYAEDVMMLAGISCHVETADYSSMPDDWTVADEDHVFRAAWRRAEVAVGATRYLSGVRADESGVRKIRMRRWGLATDRTCCPLGWWSKQDAFAYAAVNNLPIHPNYAMLGGGRWPREKLRVDGLGGIRGSGGGRAEWEREYYPDVPTKRAGRAPPSNFRAKLLHLA